MATATARIRNRGGFAPNATGTPRNSAAAPPIHQAASRPDFAASIYGALPGDATVPADAPPLFLAVSADEPLLAGASQPVFAAWRAQKRPAELHVYEKGGHGYGLNKSGATSDHWIDAFYWWLEAGGFIKAMD